MIERCLLILHNENVTRTIKLVTMFFWLSKDPIFLDNLPIKVMSFQGNSVQCQLATSYPFKLYNIVGDWTHLLDEDGARNDLLYFVIFFQKKKRRRRRKKEKRVDLEQSFRKRDERFDLFFVLLISILCVCVLYINLCLRRHLIKGCGFDGC